MKLPTLFESFWHDFLYAIRTFGLNKAFFVVAMLSLALGIGANTAIFQLLDAVRLRSLPVEHADRLAELRIAKNDHCCSGNFIDNHPNFTYTQWEQIRDRQNPFASIFAWGDQRFNMADSGEPRFAQGLWVSGDFFRALGVKPLMGRLISNQDDRLGCGSPTAVISYAFWRREFAGDPQIIGKLIPLEGHRFEISGVTSASFFGVEVGRSFDVALPLCADPIINRENSRIAKRDTWWLAVMGTLRPGWNLARASAQANAISPSVFAESVPPNYRPDQAKYYLGYKLEARPAGSGLSSLRQDYEQPLFLLLGIAGLVLLIACSNLANLMLARASNREREMAVRLAIGADRWRLIRQLLVESLTLTVAGAILGALLAQFLCNYLVAFLSTDDNPLFLELSLDWRVLGFTAALAILTCLLFGLTPALRATGTHPASAMKAAGRGLTSDRQRFGTRRVLVVSQVALSLVLVIGALLFIRSLRNLLTLDAGFREQGMLITQLDISRLSFPAARRVTLYRDVLAAVRRIPGVELAASMTIVPTSGSGWNGPIQILGEPAAKNLVPWFNSVSDDYFRTMGTPLIAGRDFNDRDTASSPDVSIVNQEFCDKYLHKTNPIGRQFRLLAGRGEKERIFQIVGFVKNSKYQNLRDSFQPLAFFPQSQDKDPFAGNSMVVRSTAPLGSLMPALKKTILAENAGIAFQFVPFQNQIQNSLLRERLMATLSGFFGLLATALAVVGLYGVISYMVARRQAEIGIRIALGASRSGILRLVLKEAVVLLGIGMIVGTVLSAAGARTASSLLYGLQPTDPVVIGTAISALAFVAILATLLPAFRAARVEPIAALREE